MAPAHSRSLHHNARCGGEIGSRLRDFLKVNRSQKASLDPIGPVHLLDMTTHIAPNWRMGRGEQEESTGWSHVALSYSWMADVIHALSFSSLDRGPEQRTTAPIEGGTIKAARKRGGLSVCPPASHDGLVRPSARPTMGEEQKD